MESTPYARPNQVSIGDGSSLPIQNTGTGLLPTPTSKFLLHHLIHVSSISKNLLFVRQFCHDNSIFFEFNSSGFLVKDLHTQEVLLQGPVNKGLYVLPSHDELISKSTNSIQHQALIREKTTPQIWHSRLGHLSPRVTSFTICQHNLPTTSMLHFPLCNACLQEKSHTLPHPLSPSRSTYAFQLLFLDVWVPAPVLSSSGF